MGSYNGEEDDGPTKTTVVLSHARGTDPSLATSVAPEEARVVGLWVARPAAPPVPTLRDVAAELAGRAGGAEALAAAEALSGTVDGLLFHEDQWFAAYRAAVGREGRPPAAGDERASQLLEWLRENLSFLPTHDDRAAYAAAVLPAPLVPGITQRF